MLLKYISKLLWNYIFCEWLELFDGWKKIFPLIYYDSCHIKVF